MSRTDIFPPQPFSTSAQYTVRTSSYNPITKMWSAVSTNSNMNTDRSGAMSRQSNVTANYVDAVSTGNLGENAFTFVRNETRNFSGEYTYESTFIFADRYQAVGTFPSHFCPTPDVNSISSLRRFNLDNEAKQKVLEKVRDSDVNLAVAWGEREQTIRLLTSTVKKLGTAYNLAKSGNFAGAAAALGISPRQGGPLVSRSNAAANWLELQYGWLPLMSDIFGLCKTLQKQMTHKEFVIVRSRRSIQDSTTSTTVSGNFEDYVVASAEYTSAVRVKMRSNSMALKTAAEVGLTNPLLVAWELVPFSFVVDWALPVGSFLSQFDSHLGWSFVVGSQTRFYKRRADKYRSVHGKPSGYKYFICSGICSAEELTITRTGITSFVDLWSLPYVKNPASMLHLANALALLTSKR